MPDPNKKKHVSQPQSDDSKTPAHNPAKGSTPVTHTEEERSDALASEATTRPEEIAGRGQVKNMNVDPVGDLAETDELSGTPGESISHDAP